MGKSNSPKDSQKTWDLQKLLVLVVHHRQLNDPEIIALVASGQDGHFDFCGINILPPKPDPLPFSGLQILEDAENQICCRFDLIGLPGHLWGPSETAKFRKPTERDIQELGHLGNYTREITAQFWPPKEPK